jgi:hypothetical protein
MKKVLVRVLGGVCGLIAGLIAIYVPLFFISMTMMEHESAKQYNGHSSVWGAIGGFSLILGITVFFGIGAYRFTRRAFSNQKSN